MSQPVYLPNVNFKHFSIIYDLIVLKLISKYLLHTLDSYNMTMTNEISLEIYLLVCFYYIQRKMRI